MAQGVANAPALQQGYREQGRPSDQGFSPKREPHRHTYGAIDLGTNNCRLLIARPNEGGFTVIDAFSRIVRLGEGVARTGALSQEAMDRAIGALSVCADKLRRRNVSLSRSVATEACRRASNGGEFADRVREETGIALDIIEPEEGTPRIRAWWSAPWGVVSLTESEGKEALEGPDRLLAYKRKRERARRAFANFATMLPEAREGIRLLGTSGTVTTLASVHLALPFYDRLAVDGLHVPIEAMHKISGMIAGMDFEERSSLPCIGNERADLVVAGCAILEAIIEIWP